MNKLFIWFMIFSPCLIIAQTSMDSIAVRQLDSLIKVSRSLTAKKQPDEAFNTIAVAEKMVLEKWGRESAAYGTVCFSRARVFQSLGNLLESEKWYQESKRIREKILGKENVDYANSLNNLAMVLQKMAKYNQAEQLFIESKSIREKILGNEHPDYAWSLNNLASLYWIMCKYEKAELNFLELKDLWAKILGKEDLDYAECLNDLGGLYFDMGKYNLAEQYFTDSKSIQEKVLGKDNPDYAWCLNNMGLVYKDQGKFEKAEQLFLEAKSIREKMLGKEHKDYANSLTILASLYEKQGNYESALSNLLEAKTIADKLLSKENPLYIYYLTNLGIIYRVVGAYNLAEPYLLEAKEIIEKTLGKEHGNYAWTLDGLANLYMAMGNYIKAEPIYLESKSIYEKVLGKEHPEYASCLNNLAILYKDLENYDKAEELFLESINIRKKILGKEHLDYMESLMNLGLMYISKGNYEKAESLYIEFDLLNQLQISKALHYLSEQELAKYINTFSMNQSNLFSFAQLTHGERLTSTCYDNALFHKGFLLNAALELKHLARTEPTASDQINLLNTLNRQLANQYSKPFLERDSVKVNQLEFKANELEKDIVRNVAGYRESVRQINWKDVQLNLKAGEVAVEFVNYKFVRNKVTDSIMYAALLVRAGDKEPQFISLFEEKQLDSLLKVNVERKADYVNNLYAFGQRGAVVLGKPQSSLYDLIWKSFEPMLKDVTMIYYSPSGQLHRLDLGAIAISEDQTFADKYKLVQLKSTRQLVVPNISNTVKDDAILFGGIKFDLDSTALKNDFKQDVALRSRGITGDLGFENVDTSLCINYVVSNAKLDKNQNSRKGKKAKSKSRGGSWSYLPGTEKEVSTIEKILQNSNFMVTTNKGYEASEEAFKKIGQNGIPSPRILHIATHGYFFPDPDRSISTKNGVTHDPDDSIGTSSEGTAKAAKSTLNYNLKDETIFKISDHPMLRSGLILAGGNASWQGLKTIEGHEDGILTAYEISQMNLFNTELVVLSACETGLGDIKGNEGVYGLQRAFKIAGAKYLIISLWQVPDKQTSELMKSFYQKWLMDKMSLPDAFRSAQKDMQDRFVDPYAWAGFVLVE